MRLLLHNTPNNRLLTTNQAVLKSFKIFKISLDKLKNGVIIRTINKSSNIKKF